MPKVKIECLDNEIPAPKYAMPGDAGLDCYSTIDTVIEPGQTKNIPLGIRMELPNGTIALVMSKSGLSSKQGLTAVIGLVDNGYRGEIKMIAHNISDKPIDIKRGKKVCQIMILSVPMMQVEYGSVDTETARGVNGFGSTGL